jgi:hypothetical protein
MHRTPDRCPRAYQAEKIAKHLSKREQEENVGYDNEDNPFGDANLTSK